jgi:hypothetical protein
MLKTEIALFNSIIIITILNLNIYVYMLNLFQLDTTIKTCT